MCLSLLSGVLLGETEAAPRFVSFHLAAAADSGSQVPPRIEVSGFSNWEVKFRIGLNTIQSRMFS